ncbi:MAG TPA: phosphatase PAP2 family protein [Tepidisphaeraceae bacterium]|jgi:membrane-associated phospholipid phosphatase
MKIERRREREWGWLFALGVFVALAAVSYAAWDDPLVRWVHAHGIDKATKQYWWWVRKARVIWPGHFASTVLIALIIGFVHRAHWRGAALILLAGVFSGANSILKWAAGRQRPNPKLGEPSMAFHPFAGGLKKLFVQENLAFPSGDVALAVATAAALSYLMPRAWPIWWALAVIVAAQRIGESAHHLSDCFAAAALGIVAFHCARLACRLLPDRSTDEGQPRS